MQLCAHTARHYCSVLSSASAQTSQKQIALAKDENSKKVETVTLRYGTTVQQSCSDKVLASHPDSKIKTAALKYKVLNPVSVSKSNALPISSKYAPSYRFPSVSAILGCTKTVQANEILLNWQLRKIDQLGGQHQFVKHMQERMDIGKDLHTAIGRYLIGGSVPREESGYWSSVWPLLTKAVDKERCMTETWVTHYRLCYRGIFDAIAIMNGERTLIEWKTASIGSSLYRARKLDDTYDYPLQMAAYIGAFNTDAAYTNLPKIKRGAIVVAKEDGQEANVFQMDANAIEYYWSQFCCRLVTFWTEMKKRNINNTVDFVYRHLD